MLPDWQGFKPNYIKPAQFCIKLKSLYKLNPPYFVSQQPYTHRHVTFKSLSNITIYVETFIDAALQALQTMAENAGKDGIRYYETVTQAIFGE